MQAFKVSKLMFVLAASFLATSFIMSSAFAAIPEPKSEGKFFQAKGTKAEEGKEGYAEEGRAGGAGYEWGRGFEVWNIILKPVVQYIGQWEDNIFYDEDDEKSDYINKLQAGINAELPINGGQHLLTGKYIEDFEWFNNFEDQDHADYTTGAGINLNFVPFSLNAEDTHRQTVDRADTEFTTRVSRVENTAHALLEIPFSAFFLESEVLNFNTNYRAPENSTFDHNDFTFYQRVGFDVAPSTQLLGEYGYENLDYPKQGERNGDANQAMIGLRGNWTERITYQVWGGFQSRIYDNDVRPDFNGAVVRSAVQYDITDKSNVIAKFNRDPQESTFDNQSFYVRNKGSLALRQQVAERIFFLADGSLSYNEYSRITNRLGQENTRHDYVWESAVGLQYLMPNDVVSIFGEYRVRGRDTNLTGLEYVDNTVNAGIKAAF